MEANGSAAAGMAGNANGDRGYLEALLLRHQEGQQVERQAQRQAMFPLSKEVLIKAAQPVAMVALATTCTALVLAAQGLDSEKNDQHVVAVLNALVFAYLPLGLFGLLIAVAVQSNPALVGLSSGFILAHLLLPTVIGGVVNVVKSGEDPRVVTGVSALLFGCTILAWSFLCSYPKFLHIRRAAVIPPLQVPPEQHVGA